MSINDVPRFLAIFDLPTYLPCSTLTSDFGGAILDPLLPTLTSVVINGHSPMSNKDLTNIIVTRKQNMHVSKFYLCVSNQENVSHK